MSVTTKLIFQGVKFYWRTRNTIDVTIVDHTEKDITEVILYDPSLGKEAPRIYLSSSVLYSKLDQDDIEHQLSFAKRNCVPITEKFIDGIINKAKSDFILGRLIITEYSVDAKAVTLTFQVSSVDGDTADLVREQPAALVPYKAVQHQLLLAGVVDLAIKELNAEKAKLHTACDKAVALEKIAETSARKLNAQERWRIPLVFIKISNSKRLSASDAKIWTTVSQNMKSEEDATKMAAVLARATSKQHLAPSPAPTASSSRNVSFSGNHHVVSPSATPRHSKLHQATAATRQRTQATHAACSGSHTRESSLRQGDADDSGESSYNRRRRASKGEDGENSYNSKRKAAVKDDAGETSYNSKKKAGGKSPKAKKRSASKNGGSKGARKPFLERLRRLSLSLTSSAPSDDAADADCSAGTAEAGAAAMDGQSALQRMIANLGALNNSLRSSFLSGLSGKSGSSAKTALVELTGLGADARPSSADHTPVDDTAIAIQQARQGAALVPKAVEEYSDVPVTHKPQRAFFGAFGGAATTATTASGTTTSDATAATMPGAAQKYVTNSGTSAAAPATAAAEFTIQGFFSGLVHWRSGNKIYVDEVA